MGMRLERLEPGMMIPYGGDRLATVPADLAAAFVPGDRLVVVQDSGALLHIPAAEWDTASDAVGAAADAFQAMTAVRPYRPNPMAPGQAIEELQKYSGIQFDPSVVKAFARTATARGDWPRVQETDIIAAPQIPMIGQVAKLRGAASSSASASSETV